MTDTIAACSTASGSAAIAIVRLSGPAAWSVAHRLCDDLPAQPEPRRVHLSRVVDPESGELLDRALVTLFEGPNSYSGEDMVELSCHGGWLSPTLVLEAAVKSGCRSAEPGEFTRRAYLNGKLDLVQAEAVMDLVEGRSSALRRAALGQLERGLSARLESLRNMLLSLEALLAHHIDFPEEDEPPVALDTVVRAADAVISGLEVLLETAPEGELLREGAVTVLAGRPNAGKSSLFNALAGEDRAIVTATPGTTRDAIEALVTLGGYPFRLVDTAGMRDTDEHIEQLGVEVARRYLGRADLILLCLEDGADVGETEEAFAVELTAVPVVVVRTKSDLTTGPGPGSQNTEGLLHESAAGSVSVSTVTGAGLGELRQLLPRLVYSGLVEATPEAPILIRRRHAAGLERALVEIKAFSAALAAGMATEVAATHLRPAETALEELLGVISLDDVLDVVFKEFCIGK